MMVYRTGNSSDPTGWGAYHDMEAFGIFTCIGKTKNLSQNKKNQQNATYEPCNL